MNRKQESTLLQKINRGLPTTVQRRYDELQAKLHAETISTDEYQELLKLIEKAELADAARLQALLELAQLRQVSLGEVMNQLGIHSPTSGLWLDAYVKGYERCPVQQLFWNRFVHWSDN